MNPFERFPDDYEAPGSLKLGRIFPPVDELTAAMDRSIAALIRDPNSEVSKALKETAIKNLSLEEALRALGIDDAKTVEMIMGKRDTIVRRSMDGEPHLVEVITDANNN